MRCLSDYLEILDRQGRLARVAASLSCEGEAIELARRLAAKHRRAMLALSPDEYDTPLAMGLYGSDDLVRAALAGGWCDEDEMAQRLEAARSAAPAGGWFERVVGAVRTTGAKIADRVTDGDSNGSTEANPRKSPAVRQVKRPPCQQVVHLGDDIDLGRLPVPRIHPGGATRLLTAALIATADPETHQRRLDRADVYLIDRSHVAIDFAPHEPADRLRRQYRRRREPMPLAITVGGDPALLPLSVAPLDHSADLLDWLSRLRGRPIDIARGRSVDLDITADAEIVLEGRLEPDGPAQRISQRPLYTGLLGRPRRLPIVELSAVTQRVDAILPAMIRAAGSAHTASEEIVLRRTAWRLFREQVRQVVPELVDLDLSPQGDGRNWLVVSIEKEYAGQATRVIHALWGWAPSILARYIVVVDRRVDVTDPAAVVRAIAQNARPDRDMLRSRGPEDLHGAACGQGESMDATSPDFDHSLSRIGIDATTKHSHSVGRPLRTDRATRRKVDDRWEEYGID